MHVNLILDYGSAVSAAGIGGTAEGKIKRKYPTLRYTTLREVSITVPGIYVGHFLSQCYFPFVYRYKYSETVTIGLVFGRSLI
jgi:hypothetical protein